MPRPEDPQWKSFSVESDEGELRSSLANFGRRAADQPGAWLSEAQAPVFGEHPSTAPVAWLGIALFKRALTGGPPLKIAGWEGNLVVPREKIIESIQTLFAVRLVRIAGGGGKGNGSLLFSSDTTMVSFEVHSRGEKAEISVVTVDEEVVRKAVIFDRCLVQDDPKKGSVFALVRGMGGFSITRVGAAGTPIQRTGYDPKVIQAYDHIIEEFRTDSPCGRLIILSGSPGTGKTFLVRSMLGTSPRSAFILVPPHLVAELGGPDILPALTSAKQEYDGNVVLVIEDADECLVKRKEGNMNAISSMLNLGDGILGSTLDIRILATTNAQTIEMDAATRRPGRLCRHIEVGPLSAAQASAEVSRLVGNPVKPFKEEATLAEVYAKARELGWKPPPIEKGVPQRPEIL